MLHPATAHFAVVLPIVASVFGVISLISKTESMRKLFTRTTVLAAVAMGVVAYTGNQAGPEIWNYLSEDGQEVLKAHKTLGFNLAITLAIVAVIAMIGCKLEKFILQIVAVIAVIAVSATTLYQGKMGGELVYNHGTPFKSYIIMDSLSEAADNAEAAESDEEKIEAYEDALDDIKMHDEEVNAYYGVVGTEDSDDDE